MMKKSYLLGSGILTVGLLVGFFMILPRVNAQTATPFVACSSNADCSNPNNPTSNHVNTTVCYYPGTAASYCGTPLSPGDSMPSCAFPNNSINEQGYAAIEIACQNLFAVDYNRCKAAGQGLDCKYSNQSLAFNCGMPGAGQGGPGYCLPGAYVASCIQPMTEAELAAAVGATCSSVPVTTAPSSPSTSTTTTTKPSKPTGGGTTTGVTVTTPGTSFTSSINSGLSAINQELTNTIPSGSTGGSSSIAGSNNCSTASTANALSALVTSLQSAESILSSSSVSPDILTGIENLIASISQTLPSISSCLGGN